MASKKGYSRYFLILQEDEKGYVLDKGKNSSGYVKMEKKSDKCKISYYAQNINPSMGTYYMVLICKDNQTEKMVVLGKVVMDGQGKVDMNCEYDIDNIGNSKMSMQHIVGAVIAKISEDNVIPLLTGFVSTPIPSGWKQYKLINFKEERKKITQEISKEILDIKNTEDNKDKNREETEDNNDESTENKKDGNIFEKYEEAISTIVNKREDENTEPSKSQDVEFCSLEESIIRKHKEDKPVEVSKKDMPIGRMGAYFKSIVYECEEVDYMGDEIPNCIWYKIPINSIEDLYDSSKFNRYTILYYPMICYHSLITPYKHFCAGYLCDDKGVLKYIVYAVPGIRDKKNQPYGGRTGFVTWIPTKKSSGYGYWLMFYDIKKSTAVVPVKKDYDSGKIK